MIKIDNLVALGLELNEARVYLALLELGPSPVSRISQKAGINRTTGYDILERLSIDGLVRTHSSPKSKKQFIAEHPRRFMQWMEGKKRTAEKNESKAQEILPLLLNLYKTENKPSITFHEGFENIQKLFAQTLETKDLIYACTDTSRLSLPYIQKYAQWYMRERLRRKVKIRLLLSREPDYLDFVHNHPAKKYTEFRVVPERFAQFKGSEINIFEDKLLILIMTPPHFLGVQIQSQSLTQVLRTLYEMAWEQGKEIE